MCTSACAWAPYNATPTLHKHTHSLSLSLSLPLSSPQHLGPLQQEEDELLIQFDSSLGL